MTWTVTWEPRALDEAAGFLKRDPADARSLVASTRARLKTASAIALADAAQGMSSADWQRTYLRENDRSSGR